ncbi:type II toxin-antitoxin system HicA family toxin [Desulfococcaceae bacterium HSG8]|nr:type II toxin-antitoxin system HicA family toxin [Desulfococcaceae bacterium HSG8]
MSFRGKLKNGCFLIFNPESTVFKVYRNLFDLLSLGFEEKHIEGSHVRFKNHHTNAVIVLSDQKIITLHHFRMIEKVLEEKGLMSREEFEGFFT